MDKSEIAKFEQTCFEYFPTIIIGSGASIPLGLPSMNTLSDYLEINLRPDGEDEVDLWLLVRTALANGDNLE